MKTICTLLFFIGAALQLVTATVDNNGPIVKLPAGGGTVRGLQQEVNGKKINFFQGILLKHFTKLFKSFSPVFRHSVRRGKAL